MIILYKLIIAHLIGDFVLQTKAMTDHKTAHKVKSYWLYVHVVIHMLLVGLIVWDTNLWYAPIIIGCSHLGIDLGKLYLENAQNSRRLFAIDQLAHILVIILVALAAQPLIEINVPELYVADIFLFITCMLILTQPTAILMRVFFSKWQLTEEEQENNGLKNAGWWIGILERVLIFLFIVTNHFTAVGWLLTAKSVFRFGDLSKSNNRKLTEYMLIGTLLSFGIAIITGLLFDNLKH